MVKKEYSLVYLVIAVQAFGLGGCGNSEPTSPLTPLRTYGDVSIGCMAAGTIDQEAFVVSNTSEGPVHLGTFDVGCDCLRLVPSQQVIGPGESMIVLAVMDLRNEPDFLGGLDVPVTLFDANGADILHFNVSTQVVLQAQMPSFFEVTRAHREDASASLVPFPVPALD